ncbi:hypothetical protein [Thiocystis violacea]|uniref:hypothetical protein n=1 Tax=Thiocystis violacea TaxID=13725 RepID=UPI001F5B1701|nr:hypothetical protein [Thiocystis violacea]
MRRDQTSLLPRTIPPSPPAARPATGSPSLWNRLDPTRRQQLAQLLATLIRRLPPISARPPAETPDEFI